MSDTRTEAAIVVSAQSNVDSDPLYGWVRAQFASMINGQHCCELVLSHLDPNDNPAHMQRYTLNRWDEQNANSLAMHMRTLAQRDADMRGNNERYTAQAFWPTGEGTYTMILIDGTTISRHNLASTEPPTSEGMVKQMMRHNEALMRVAAGSMKEVLDVQDRLIAKLEARNAQLEQGRFKVLEMGEALLSAQVERENERARSAAAEMRKNIALQEFLQFTPLIRNKIIQWLTGEKISAGSPGYMQWRDFFDGMTVDQMRNVLDNLPAGKQAQLLNLYKETMDADMKRKDAAEKAAQPQGDAPASSSTQGAAAAPPENTAPNGDPEIQH